MARSLTTLSLSHNVVLDDDALVISGMRSGLHFDVVFGAAVAGEAASTLIAFLKEVIDRMRVDNPETDPSNVFSQVTIDGDWFKQTTTQGTRVVSETLRLHACGWTYQDFDGVKQTCGTLKMAVTEDNNA